MADRRLSSLRKKELVDLATELGVDTDGFKSDIEARISQHLAEYQGTLIANPRYAPFYTTVISSPGPAGSVGYNRRRSVQKTPKLEVKRTITLSPSAYESSPIAPAAVVHTEISEPHVPVMEGGASFVSTLLARVSNILSQTKEVAAGQLQTSAAGFMKITHRTRSTLSSVSSVIQLEALYELFLLLRQALPPTVKISSITIPYGPTMAIRAVYFPDYHVLGDYGAFWQPLLFWVTYFVATPLVASYLINFTMLKASTARARHNFDPVTYNVTRLVAAYLFFIKFAGTADTVVTGFAEPFVPFVKSEPIVKAGLDNTPFIGSAIGTLVSLYVAILL
ncbi:hypothetical protein V1525DRAFT_431504 [Lipomyces kononenkoae]|uniref:Uncharacterized protein n=1 Tax=Lipomyces kononenkoae TaxID=34357 RepID=A0ACC3T4F6_LIPKO